MISQTPRNRTGQSNPRIAIIGAGLAGIGLAVKLKTKGIETFTVFEKSDGPGGTWRDNRYPGAGCDVPSILYSFSFKPWTEWRNTYGSQPEILRYIEETVDEFGIRDACRFQTRVKTLRWNEADAEWSVTTERGDIFIFDVVVSCVGLLNVPNIPTLAGGQEYLGLQVHTARWPEDLEVIGKRVAVVGTGSSAAQVVPVIAGVARQVTVYQREPGWVFPKHDRQMHANEAASYRKHPWRQQLVRLKEFWIRERGVKAFKPGSKLSRKREFEARSWLAANIADEDMRARLTPDYPVGCKRLVRDSNFLRSLAKPSVELVAHEVVALTRSGLRTDDGVEHDADVIVWATGFTPTQFLSTLEVYGRGGRSLREVWDEAGGAEAFAGVAVHGFPNLFLHYGPNTNSATTSIIWVLETQSDYVIRAVRWMKRRGVASVEVKQRAQDRYNAWLQKTLAESVWAAGCHNYFRSSTGKSVTQWPHTSSLYWLILRLASARNPLLYERRARERSVMPHLASVNGGPPRVTTSDELAQVAAKSTLGRNR